MKKKPFGARLRAARDAALMTQRELAERLGVTVTTVSRWESAGVEPHAPALRKLQRVLPAVAS